MLARGQRSRGTARALRQLAAAAIAAPRTWSVAAAAIAATAIAATALVAIASAPALLGAGCGARSAQGEVVLPAGRDSGPPSTDRDSGPRRDGPPVKADASVPSIDPAVRACLMAASCDPSGAAMRVGDETVNASQCLEVFAQRDWALFTTMQGIGPSRELFDRLLTCGAESDCRAFYACFGGDLVFPASCQPGAHCEGDRIVAKVASGDERSFDCSTIAGRCVDQLLGSPMACCRPRACDVVDEDSQPRCAEGLFCSLVEGGGFYFDCSVTGRRCIEGSPITLCAGSGDQCDSDDHARCDGSRVTYCADGNQEATFDCASTGFRTACDPTAVQGAVPCRARYRDCDPWDYHGECGPGSTAQICVDGQIQRVDCEDLGFEICYEQIRDDDVGARCGFVLP